MAISRGAYGSGCKITEEFFLVGAYLPQGGCYTDMIGAPTRGMAYSRMSQKFGKECRIELRQISRAEFAERGGFEAVKPHVGGSRTEPMLDRG